MWVLSQGTKIRTCYSATGPSTQPRPSTAKNKSKQQQQKAVWVSPGNQWGCECPHPAPRIQLREAREWPAFGRASTDGTAVESQGIKTADSWAPRQESGHKKVTPKPGFFFPMGDREALKCSKKAKRGKVSPGAENLEPGWVQQKAEESTRAGMTTTMAPEPAHRTGSSSGSPRSPGEQATRFSTGAPLSRSVGFLLAGGKRQSSFVLNPGPALFAVVLEALHPLWEMPAHPLNGTVAHACPQPHWTGYRISTQDTSFANPSPVERASQGAGVKNPAVKAGNAGLIPGLGRSPGGGNGNILQYSCLGNPTDREACWATVHRVKKRVRHDLVTKIATENNNPNGKG